MRWLPLLAALVLAACSKPQPVIAPLWEVTGPEGQRGWLLGTIHALPEPVAWRTPPVDRALAQSDRLVVEVATLGDGETTRAVFARLAASPGLPPLAERVPGAQRAALARLVRETGTDPAALDRLESWAAAITLTQLLVPGHDAANGIDRALLNAAKGKPVAELEGAERQLAVLDRLAEDDQRAMLRAVLGGADHAEAEAQRLAALWARGDTDGIARATAAGLLADPELREALLLKRNREWTAAVEARLRLGERPLVAVGAAHLAGADGLPAQLAARGWRVTRLQ